MATKKLRDAEYELTKVLKDEKCTIKVYRPILEPEERERRFERFKQGVAEFMKAVIREERERETSEKKKSGGAATPTGN